MCIGYLSFEQYHPADPAAYLLHPNPYFHAQLKGNVRARGNTGRLLSE